MTNLVEWLPSQERLDKLVSQLSEPLNAEPRVLKAASAIGDYIDFIMLDTPMTAMSSYMVGVLGYDNSDEAVSMLNGMLFARQIVSQLYRKVPHIRLPEYFIKEENDQVIRNRVHAETQQYLGGCPHLDNLIRAMMPVLDGGRTYPHRVEETAALMFMGAETAHAEVYLAGELAELSVESVLHGR